MPVLIFRQRMRVIDSPWIGHQSLTGCVKSAPAAQQGGTRCFLFYVDDMIEYFPSKLLLLLHRRRQDLEDLSRDLSLVCSCSSTGRARCFSTGLRLISVFIQRLKDNRRQDWGFTPGSEVLTEADLVQDHWI